MGMQLGFVEDPAEVGDYMQAMVAKYYRDCTPYANWATLDFYNAVKRIPYNMEDGIYQALMRPALVLNGQAPVIACVNKAITMGSFLRCKNIPYRYKIVAKNSSDPLHHVYTEAYIGGRWIPMDCTYPENQMGATENWGRVVTK
jgi:hypothetical protein